MARAKRIIVVPRGGLGNRLRVVAATRHFAQVYGRNLLVLWNLNPELNCRYETLFRSHPAMQVCNVNRHVARLIEVVCGAIPRWLAGNVDCFDDGTLERMTTRLHHEGDVFSRFLIFSVNSEFYGPGLEPAWFVPVDNLAVTINTVCAGYAPHTIGVHIRRQDNELAKQYSQTSVFVEMMKEAVADDAGTRFYLSTDCPETEAYLRQIFGARIISREKSLDRNDSSAIKDALVDLFCLSRTNLILGSYWSSFSDIAAQLGGVPLKIAMKS